MSLLNLKALTSVIRFAAAKRFEHGTERRETPFEFLNQPTISNGAERCAFNKVGMAKTGQVEPSGFLQVRCETRPCAESPESKELSLPERELGLAQARILRRTAALAREHQGTVPLAGDKTG